MSTGGAPTGIMTFPGVQQILEAEASLVHGISPSVFMLTIVFFAFGTSIPIVPLPGIGAMIRIPRAAKLNAISSSKFLILEIRTPAAGIISYKVTVGPTVAEIFEIVIFFLNQILIFLHIYFDILID